MKGIILHGGHGTRLRPITHTGPKQLLPIANKPMSLYGLEDLIDAGIKEIAIILGDVFPEKVKDFYGDGSRFGVDIKYIYQDQPKGIAHAIGLCKDFVGEDKFVVYLGDNILKGRIGKFSSEFEHTQADAFILLCRVNEPSRFGVATIKDNSILKIVEKPKSPESNLAVIGIYFLTPAIFPIINKLSPSWRGELEITEALQSLIASDKKVEFRHVTGWWKDTGTPDDILDANRFMLDSIQSDVQGTVESNESLQGRVIVGKNSKVSKGAIVRGPVIIGKSTIVENGVYIGPYSSIGNNVHIKRGEIESSIIMDDVTIDMNSRIVDSIIASCCEIAEPPSSSPRGNRFLIGEGSKVFL